MTAIGRDNFRKAIDAAIRELISGSDVPDLHHDLVNLLCGVKAVGVQKDADQKYRAFHGMVGIAEDACCREKERRDEAAELAKELAAIRVA